MSKVSVVYWSQSGNTQAMAEAVAAGITEAGKEAEVVLCFRRKRCRFNRRKSICIGLPCNGRRSSGRGRVRAFYGEH